MYADLKFSTASSSSSGGSKNPPGGGPVPLPRRNTAYTEVRKVPKQQQPGSSGGNTSGKMSDVPLPALPTAHNKGGDSFLVDRPPLPPREIDHLAPSLYPLLFLILTLNLICHPWTVGQV